MTAPTSGGSEESLTPPGYEIVPIGEPPLIYLGRWHPPGDAPVIICERFRRSEVAALIRLHAAHPSRQTEAVPESDQT